MDLRKNINNLLGEIKINKPVTFFPENEYKGYVIIDNIKVPYRVSKGDIIIYTGNSYDLFEINGIYLDEDEDGLNYDEEELERGSKIIAEKYVSLFAKYNSDIIPMDYGSMNYVYNIIIPNGIRFLKYKQ